MKPWRTWLAGLGLSGALAIISGCGGGDIPDPGSDGQAGALPSSAAPEQAAPAPAPAAAAPKEETAPEARTEVAAAPADAPAPAPPPAEKPAPSEKSAQSGKPAGGSPPPDRGSATAEMLALATKDQAPPPAGSDSAQGNNPGAGGAPGGPSGPGGPGGGPGGPGGPGGGGPGGPGGMGMGMGMGGGVQAQMQQRQQMQQQMRMNMQPGGMAQGMQRGGMPGGGMGMPGGPGGPGGMGGAPANNKPPDFTSPTGAVQAFLDALKARDLDRLVDATALRAQTEAGKKYQDMFRRISDNTLSESELNSLAARLEGYQVMGENPATSTGRLGVVLQKRVQNSANYWRITITVRREKKGWGVCDIGQPIEFKTPSIRPNTGTRSKR